MDTAATCLRHTSKHCHLHSLIARHKIQCQRHRFIIYVHYCYCNIIMLIMQLLNCTSVTVTELITTKKRWYILTASVQYTPVVFTFANDWWLIGRCCLLGWWLLQKKLAIFLKLVFLCYIYYNSSFFATWLRD